MWSCLTAQTRIRSADGWHSEVSMRQDVKTRVANRWCAWTLNVRGGPRDVARCVRAVETRTNKQQRLLVLIEAGKAI